MGRSSKTSPSTSGRRQGDDGEGAAAQTLFQELAPVRGAMFLLAFWPIRSDAKGRATVSMVSHSTCYTVLVYALWSVLNVRVTGERWRAMMEGAPAVQHPETSDLNHSIYHIILLALLTQHWAVPVLVWSEARSIAKYLNDWTSFQDEWRRLSGRPVVLGLRGRAAGCAATGLLLPLPLLLLMVQAGVPVLHALASYPPLCFFALVGGTWATLCTAVERAAVALRQLHEEDCGRGLALLDVRAHGQLWLRLRVLAAQTGEAQAYTLLVYTVYSMVQGLVAATGTFIALAHGDMSYGNAMQAIIMVLNLQQIYTVHEHGHRASHAAGEALTFEMLKMNPRSKERDLFNAEARTLLIATAVHSEHDATTISVGGFADCSRSSILEVYNMLLLNLIVLLQFAYFSN